MMTTISIEKETKDLLDVCGSKRDTYSDIVKRIVEEYIEVRR